MRKQLHEVTIGELRVGDVIGVSGCWGFLRYSPTDDDFVRFVDGAGAVHHIEDGEKMLFQEEASHARTEQAD